MYDNKDYWEIYKCSEEPATTLLEKTKLDIIRIYSTRYNLHAYNIIENFSNFLQCPSIC